MKFLFINLISLFVVLETVQANDLSGFLRLRKLGLEYKSFFPGGSYPLITDNGLNREQDKELNLRFNFDVMNLFYWDNNVHGSTDKDRVSGSGQFRLVGWEFELGVTLTQWLKAGYYHHSQHLLDAVLPYRFPVQDAFILKIDVYESTRKKGSIF